MPDPTLRLFFSGIGGAGMNPLARLMATRGHTVIGSDRAFDQGHKQTELGILRATGVAIVPQDGAAIDATIDRFVYSAAVEPDTAEMRRARAVGLDCCSRPQLLAEVVDAGGPGVAIAGTSGKSTVVGMLAWILRCTDRTATVLGGASLAEDGATHMGCFAAAGAVAPVVAEACESDGTLVGYHPGIGLIHNITRDHAEVDTLRTQFATFAGQSRMLAINAACPEARILATDHPCVRRYGRDAAADVALEVVRPGPVRGQGVVRQGDGDEALIDLPQPGVHNLDNAAAAVCVAVELGIPLVSATAALASFPGVARRYQVLGTTASGITVIDDYAHNADKIRAAVSTAQEGCNRLLVVFQPHGFGPARFLRDELRALLPELLRPQDHICYAGIYYAGGTVARDISSRDLADDLPSRVHAHHVADHQGVLSWAAVTAVPRDTVLVLGARDPALPALARALYDLL